jgi:hypothetical protein
MNNKNNPIWLVKMEFKRIQTFLFEGTQLATCVGANVLLGELGRFTIPQIAVKLVNSFIKEKPDGNWKEWDNVIKELEKFQSYKNSIAILKDDPLHLPNSNNKSDFLNYDDPLQNYMNYIMSRDGGHFNFVFPTKELAKTFIKHAESEITKLPDLLTEFQLHKIEYKNDCWSGEKEKENTNFLKNYLNETSQSTIGATHLPFSLFKGGKEAPGKPASVPNVEFKPETKHKFSISTQAKREKHQKFKKNQPKDILGLIKNKLPPMSRKLLFEQIAASGKLAVIHADGNNIGKRSKEFFEKKQNNTDDFFQKEFTRELFFYQMRSSVRISLKNSLNKTFKQKSSPNNYHLLMLGGDDLLLVCDALKAFEFVINYEKEIQNTKLLDDKKLTNGIGIAIAHKKYPFYHLHDIVEDLAKQAKTWKRGLGVSENFSVVDWIITTESKAEVPNNLKPFKSFSIANNICHQFLKNRPCGVLSDIKPRFSLE